MQALVFARCLGFVVRAPGFSHPSVPAPVRACFALVLALALARGRVLADVSTAALVLALASEAALGAALGLAVSMLYDGAYAGGRALDDYVGIRAAVPSAGFVAGAGFGRLWSLAFVTAFFAFGGDRVALGGFAGTRSRWLPPGAAFAAGRRSPHSRLRCQTTLVRAALAVAGPALALAFSGATRAGGRSRVRSRDSRPSRWHFRSFSAECSWRRSSKLPGVVTAGAARPWFDFDALARALSA